MTAHEKANTIPDPFQFPTASLKVLMMHDEVFQNSNRFLELTPEINAGAELITGANIERLLSLLPQRVRMEVDNLNTVESTTEKRQAQYNTIRVWVSECQRRLLCQGTEIQETKEMHVTMITGHSIDHTGAGQNGG